MLNIALKIFCFITLAISIISCKKENIVYVTSNYSNYFPLKYGSEKIYAVTEITIDKPLGKYDTVRYEVKERVDSSFADNTGKIAYRLERYTRIDSSNQWQIQKVVICQIIDNQFQQVEDNLRFVKFLWPFKIGMSWNGNIYNTLGEQSYVLNSFDKSDIIGNVLYDSVMVVNQMNEETLVSKNLVQEKYVKNIGLAFKTSINVSINPSLSNMPLEQKVVRGTFYYQELK